MGVGWIREAGQWLRPEINLLLISLTSLSRLRRNKWEQEIASSTTPGNSLERGLAFLALRIKLTHGVLQYRGKECLAS